MIVFTVIEKQESPNQIEHEQSESRESPSCTSCQLIEDKNKALTIMVSYVPILEAKISETKANCEEKLHFLKVHYENKLKKQIYNANESDSEKNFVISARFGIYICKGFLEFVLS